jgi:hypothetical protein
LYQIAKVENVPFQNYGKWIESKMERLYLEFIYKRKLTQKL